MPRSDLAFATRHRSAHVGPCLATERLLVGPGEWQYGPGVADTRMVVASYWSSAEARDWRAFGDLLADDVIYEAPQSRERVRGREAYVRFNVEGFPSDWHLAVERLVVDGRQAVTWIRFEDGGKDETGLCFFTLNEDGKIARIADFWPEPYEPPANRADLAERY
jgi:ketosteroid isomerase-like protein